MNIDDMKKIYITPEIENLNMLCHSYLAVPSLGVKDDDPITDDGNDAADEYRGSWEGIWDNM